MPFIAAHLIIKSADAASTMGHELQASITRRTPNGSEAVYSIKTITSRLP